MQSDALIVEKTINQDALGEMKKVFTDEKTQLQGLKSSLQKSLEVIVGFKRLQSRNQEELRVAASATMGLEHFNRYLQQEQDKAIKAGAAIRAQKSVVQNLINRSLVCKLRKNLARPATCVVQPADK